MKDLDTRADAFLAFLIKSKFSWLWIAAIFLSGWFGSYYFHTVFDEQISIELHIPEGGLDDSADTNRN